MEINLGLQGGGAHGAFTWGVLDRLLDEQDLDIKAISGTSAGAINAAALKCGLLEGGAQGAKDKLRELWHSVGVYAPASNFQEDLMAFAGPFAGIWEHNLNRMGLTPSLDKLEKYWSPYSNNPYDFNLLRNIISRQFDEKLLRSKKGPKLFVNATNVRSGKIKIFQDKELSHEALLASAALPSVFKAVEIDGEAYWDGGFTGNPALTPLIEHTDCGDLLIVHINPLYRDEVPVTPIDIENRVNEISFNTPLLRELRQIDFITRWMKKNQLNDESFKTVRVHSIADDEFMNKLSAASKILANQKLINQLYQHGFHQADQFLEQNRSHIGQKSTLDLRKLFA